MHNTKDVVKRTLMGTRLSVSLCFARGLLCILKNMLQTGYSARAKPIFIPYGASAKAVELLDHNPSCSQILERMLTQAPVLPWALCR